MDDYKKNMTGNSGAKKDIGRQRPDVLKKQERPISYRDKFLRSDRELYHTGVAENVHRDREEWGEIPARGGHYYDQVPPGRLGEPLGEQRYFTPKDRMGNNGYASQYGYQKIHQNQETAGRPPHVDGKPSSSSWNFRDLRNKKQTGDLYKRILFYTRKKNGGDTQSKSNVASSKEYKTINIVSSRVGEGVTTILSNLTAYVENQGRSILVIDANLQNPGLNRVFNLPERTAGLMNLLARQIGFESAVTRVSSATSVLPAGFSNNQINIGLEQEFFGELLNYYRQFYEFIFIDCPPVLSSTDALSIASAADLSFLVVRSAKVQKPVLERAKILLQNDECEIGGIVLNRAQQVIPGWLYRYI